MSLLLLLCGVPEPAEPQPPKTPEPPDATPPPAEGDES